MKLRKIEHPHLYCGGVGIYGTPKVVHNVLVDYHNYKNQRQNTTSLRLTADGGTRKESR